MRSFIRVVLMIGSMILVSYGVFAQNIDGFTPKSATVGSIVTVVGDFGTIPAQNQIYFGTIKANLVSSSKSELKVIVPEGAATCNLILCYKNNYFSSKSKFVTIYSPVSSAVSTSMYAQLSQLKFTYVPSSFATGDLDNDGLVDLLVGCNADTSVYVYKNNNTVKGLILAENFSKVAKLKASTKIAALQIGDVDGDGRFDIFVLNQAVNSFSVIKNIGRKNFLSQTSFANKIDFTTGTSPIAIRLHDINKDHKLDVVVANYNSNTISVFQNRTSLGVLTSSTFSSKFDLPTGLQPIDIQIADVDLDNRRGIDFVVANYNSKTISVFKRKTTTSELVYANDTSYTNFDLYVTQGQPFSLHLDDLNNDDYPDILVTNSNLATISAFRNKSGEVFFLENKFDFVTNTTPKSITCADVTGDGKMDILAVNITSGNVSVLQNVMVPSSQFNNSTILPKVDFTTGAQPDFIQVADFDNDGKPDFATLDIGDKQVSFRRNTLGGTIMLNGTFNNVIVSSGDTSIIQTCKVKAKGLGTNQLTITPTGSNLQIALKSDSGYVSSPIQLSPINDSIAEFTLYVRVIGGATKSNYLANITFTSSNVLTQNKSFGVSNGIPKVDSIIPYAANIDATVYLKGHNFGTNKSLVSVDFGGVKAPVETLNDTVMMVKVPKGALNSNVLVNVSGYQSKTINRFYPTFIDGDFLNQYCFAPAVTYTCSEYPLVVTNADYNEDGRQDLIFNHGNGLGIFSNKTNSFRVDTAFKNYNYKTLFATNIHNSDLDGDRRSDVIVNNTTEADFTIYRNKLNSDSITLTGNFETGLTISNYGAGAAITTADIDLDGKPEILIANNGLATNNANTVSVFQNKSNVGVLNSNSFAFPFEFKVHDNPSVIVTGDLTNDDFPEIITLNKTTNLNIIQNKTTFGLLNPDGYYPSFDFALPKKASDVEIVDIDMDGKNDIIVAVPSLGQILIYRNVFSSGLLETGSFQAPVIINVGGEPNAFTVADFDGDARPDITVANYNDASVSLFKNIYTGGAFTSNAFQAKVDFKVGDSPYDVRVVDIDNDGKPEIITSNSGGVSLGIGLPVIGTISVLHNAVKPNATAIEDRLEKIMFTIYPNPANQYVHLSVDNKNEIKNIVVYNSTGIEVVNFQDVHQSFVTLLTNDLAKGIYFVKLTTNKGVGVERLEIR